jgi:hypothetical protein
MVFPSALPIHIKAARRIYQFKCSEELPGVNIARKT